MQEIKDLKTHKDRKEWAQDTLMHAMSNALGYWQENLTDTERELLGADGVTELHTLMQAQADRVAKMLGYDKAWTS